MEDLVFRVAGPLHDGVGLLFSLSGLALELGDGRALVCAGHSAEHLEDSCCLCPGNAVFVPAGTWHNIKNVGKGRLKLSSIYAPPHHPRGTVHPTRADAAGGGR